MTKDSQLLNLAIAAPVLDGRSLLDGDAESPRKYCTHGLMVPLQIVATTRMQNRQIRRNKHEKGGYPPYHTLKHWKEHLIPRRYPDNLSPSDIQLLILRVDEIFALLVLIRDGCREADVGSDALKVCLLEAKVEFKVRHVPLGRPGRFVMFAVHGDLADV